MACAAGAGKCGRPEPVCAAFNYGLALMIIEADKAHLVETLPGEAGAICTFPRRRPMAEAIALEQFALARPALSQEAEAEVKEIVREILGEGGV